MAYLPVLRRHGPRALAALAVGLTASLAIAAPLPTAKVADRAMPKELILTGALVANQQSDVAANASGRVLRTFVERGAIVRQGAPLAQLDVEGATLTESEARANLEVALAQQELASGQCARNEALFKKGAISKDEWERIASQCRTTVGQASAAQARAAMARKSLGDATIRAPFAGMIGERFVSVGEYVQPPTKVVSLVELKPLRLQITVPEADVGSVSEGQTVRFEVQAYRGKSFEGVVAYLAPAVRTSSRDLIVEARVDNLDGKLRPGMFATAHLRLPDQQLPVVPRSALREQDGLTRLFAVVDGHAVERLVQAGATVGDATAIIDGLKAGETVVTQPPPDLRDGAAVE